jgi:AcrR family transcriptional regulator
MPAHERRQALIEATIPLLIEHGANISTRQVAEAAGVAEGTIFRVFESKGDLIHAAAAASLDDGRLQASLAAIPADADLRSALIAVVGALEERVTRLRAIVTLFHRANPEAHEGHPPFPPPGPFPPPPHGEPGEPLHYPRPDPRAAHLLVTNAVVEALTPHAADLAVPPSTAATAIIGLTFGALHLTAADPALSTPDEIVDLLLHGIAKDNA